MCRIHTLFCQALGLSGAAGTFLAFFSEWYRKWCHRAEPASNTPAPVWIFFTVLFLFKKGAVITATPKLAVIVILANSFFISGSIFSDISSFSSFDGFLCPFSGFHCQRTGQNSCQPAGYRYKRCHFSSWKTIEYSYDFISSRY